MFCISLTTTHTWKNIMKTNMKETWSDRRQKNTKRIKKPHTYEIRTNTKNEEREGRNIPTYQWTDNQQDNSTHERWVSIRRLTWRQLVLPRPECLEHRWSSHRCACLASGSAAAQRHWPSRRQGKLDLHTETRWREREREKLHSKLLEFDKNTSMEQLMH